MVCLNTCNGKADEQACQIKCGDLFENDVVGTFNSCAVSQKKCVPQKQDEGEYPLPAKVSTISEELLIAIYITSTAVLRRNRW